MNSHRIWAGFLEHEKLTVDSVGEENLPVLLRITDRLVELHPDPTPFRSYDDRLKCRQYICSLAMELGIDLTALKNGRSKVAMGRGLLNAWNKEYQQRFGSTIGTAGEFEVKRRTVVTRLSKGKLIPIEQERPATNHRDV